MASTINAKNTSTGVVITPDSSGQLELQTADTTRMTIDVNGNVGVGTASPSNKFHVAVSSQADDDGIIRAENTTASTVNASLTAKNYYGTSQFMQWENNGLRIGSRITTNGGAGNVIFTTGSDTERMRIDATGNVTAPNQPVACIRTDVTYNAPASDTKMVFTSLTTNVGSYYSTSTGRFTAPVAGTYFFYTSMHTNGTGSGRHTIRRNGTQFFGAAVTSTSWSNACCSGFITMAANDYLEIWCSAGAYIHGDPNWGSWGIRLVS